MRVGILKTSIGNFGQKGFYNAQEIGLARELEKLCDEVIIYKPVPQSEERTVAALEGYEKTTLNQIPCKQWGNNALWDVSVMDPTIDVLLFFSDTQLVVPEVYRWCSIHGIRMYPYIGVAESHSTSRLKRAVINSLFLRNVNVYKKCTCFAKTPTVQNSLNGKGIHDVAVAPVGLDLSIVNTEYGNVAIEDLKKKWGYNSEDRILLFIGRMTEEKQPFRMIEIFSRLHEQDNRYRLLMVGKGELSDRVAAMVTERGLSDAVCMKSQVPNVDIWELYRIAECFVNLNRQEIFGMAIMEAMYYECKVVAWKAPGPDFIIEHGISGWLAESDCEVETAIRDSADITDGAHRRIIERFTWKNTAKIIMENML